MKCYAYGKTWHMSWELPERKKEGGFEAHISDVQKKNVEVEGAYDGKYLMMKKVLLNPEPEVEKLV